MRVIQKSLDLEPKEFYRVHLNIVNAILSNKISKKEVEILSSFMSLDKKIIEHDMFNKVSRRKVMKELKLSASCLSIHIKSMLAKKFLIKDDLTEKISIREHFLPEEFTQGYQFKLTKKK